VRIFRIIFISISLSLFMSATTIRVAAAANLSHAIDIIKSKFEQIYPNIHINTIVASSGKLTAQIMHDAPYDLFLSADMKYPNILYAKGFTASKPVVYAQGRLILLSKKPRDFSKGLSMLMNKEIQTIATANPKTAPYGLAAKEAMANAKIYDAIKNKFIYGQSISQTLIYTLNATDIGLVAKSSIYYPKLRGLKKGTNWIDVDPKLYKAIEQGMVVMKNSSSPRESELFLKFVLSSNGKKILNQSGYDAQ